MIILTNKEIKKDIQAYQSQKDKATEKLSVLSKQKNHRERIRKERILKKEISHFNRLISIAREALDTPFVYKNDSAWLERDKRTHTANDQDTSRINEAEEKSGSDHPDRWAVHDNPPYV